MVFQTLSKRSAMTGYRAASRRGRGTHRCCENFGRARSRDPSFVQDAAIEAWEDEDHVADQRRIYREKRDVLLPLLRRRESRSAERRRRFTFGSVCPTGNRRKDSPRGCSRPVVVTQGTTSARTARGGRDWRSFPPRRVPQSARILDRIL